MELLHFIRREGLHAGPVFVTRKGKALNRTTVTMQIQNLAHDARVTPEKCNPRCLRQLFQATQDEIHRNLVLLAEQQYEHLLDQEQQMIGWEERTNL